MTLCFGSHQAFTASKRVQGPVMGTKSEWICADLERGTCVDATIVETRTSASLPQE